MVILQVCGVKGPSWLSVIPSFDLIEGVSVDYMHCVLLGVCRLCYAYGYSQPITKTHGTLVIESKT